MQILTSFSISLLLTAIFTLSVICLLIGLLCRADVCGIKTKMCRRKKKKKSQENIEISVIGEVWKRRESFAGYYHTWLYTSTVLKISQNISSVNLTIKSTSIDTLELCAHKSAFNYSSNKAGRSDVKTNDFVEFVSIKKLLFHTKSQIIDL